MLAPPLSRAGVSKGVSARTRLAEKQANRAAATAATAGNEDGTATITKTNQHTNKSGGGGGGGTQPLHLRMVRDVEFIVYPFSLMFYDPACEIDYLKCASSSAPRYILRGAACLILLFSISLGFEASRIDATSIDAIHDTYVTRTILIAISLGMSLIFALTSRIDIPYRPSSQLMLSGILTVIGSLWAVATVYKNDELTKNGELRSTEAGSFILFLFILHGTGRFLFFHLSCIPSGISTIIFIITASIYHSEDYESNLRVAWHCLLAFGALLISWRLNYRLETLQRQNHINELKVELGRREKADLKKEAFDLRDEMYVMTLERYDIADVDKKLEFQSPMEQAMSKLQGLSENKSLPKDAFLDIQKVIGLLGNSSDVFKVQVADQLADKNIRLDDETTRYLFDLVNSNDAYDEPRNGGGPSMNPSKLTFQGLTPSSNELDGGGGGGSGSHTERDEITSLERSQTRMATGGGGGGVGVGTIVNVPNGVLAKEERQINELLKNMDTWNFDVFDVANLTGGKPLFFVGTALFKKYNLITKFRIDRMKLSNFLNVIEAGYLKTNPYHNSVHASDVARTVHFFLHTSMKSYMTDLEIFGLIVASLIHDFDHPGKTNQYHVVTRDPKAILYNDKAVLEMHHCSAAFFLLNKDENNILSELTSKDYTQIRKIIIELVLATDLGAHFDFLAQFKSSVSSGSLDSSSPDKLIGPNAFANRLMIQKMALKASDLGHSCKTLNLHEKWTHRITEEFYRQGDSERMRGIPISPFMDRQKANLPQSQVGFLDFLVIPTMTIWNDFCNAPQMLPQLQKNREHWKDQLEHAEKKSDANTVPPTTTTTTTTTAVPSTNTPTSASSSNQSSQPTQQPHQAHTNTNVTDESTIEPTTHRKEYTGDGSNKVAPAPLPPGSLHSTPPLHPTTLRVVQPSASSSTTTQPEQPQPSTPPPAAFLQDDATIIVAHDTNE